MASTNPYTKGTTGSSPGPSLAPEWHHISHAFTQGLSYIDRRRNGLEPSITTPWPKLNQQTIDGLPWNTVTVIAGRPSHGKTLAVTQLSREAFDLNPGLDMAVLDFQFEMLGRTMAARELSMHMGRSMQQLYSAGGGKRFPDADFQAAKALAAKFNNREIYYVENSCTIDEFADKVTRFVRHVGKRVLITVDHSILFRKRAVDKNTMDTLYYLGEVLTRLKKELPVSFIILSQLNRDCESEARTAEMSAGNYIKTSDLFGADALMMCSDFIFAINKPSRLNIEKYGPQGYIVTEQLLALHILKNRDGEVGVMFMDADFSKMRISDRLTPPPCVKPLSSP